MNDASNPDGSATPRQQTVVAKFGELAWKPGVVGEVMLEATDDSSEGHAFETGEPTTSPDNATEIRVTYPPFLI